MAIDRTLFPKLGFGMMRLPRLEGGAVDVEQTKRMVDAYLAAGMNYFDTAYMYCDGKSELAVKEALTSRYPRESFFLTDKLPSSEIHSKEDRDRILSEQLEKTGAGYFDIYLMHGVQDDNIEDYDTNYDCFNWAFEQKKAGKVRHVGCSFHGTPALLTRLLDKYPEIEVVQIQLNYRDWDSPTICSGELYRILEERGIPVLVMEPVKGGSLASLEEDVAAEMKAFHPDKSLASWALRFVGSLPGVMTILSGMSTEAQMADNIGTFKDFAPLSDEERTIIQNVVGKLNASPAIGCTACRYCTKGCPMQINIPEIFRVLSGERMAPGASRAEFYYKFLIEAGSGRASDCLRCGQCEHICPQHLPIIDLIAEAAEKFE